MGKMRVVVRLMGGLGNQMFQYAAALKIASDLDAKLEVDTSLLSDSGIGKGQRSFELSDLFCGPFIEADALSCARLYPVTSKIEDRILSRIIRVFFPGDLWLQKGHCRFTRFVPSSSLVGVIGRFQSEKYFESEIENVRHCFAYKLELSKKADKILRLAKESTSVAVHVRRGDYVTDPVYSKSLGFVGEDYLINAMNLVRVKLGVEPRFFVFSDDHNWCHEFFGESATIMTKSYLSNAAHSDFMLMSNFCNIIISNSTFAWWAAKLAEPNVSMIVAPKRWAADGDFDENVIPKSWLSI